MYNILEKRQNNWLDHAEFAEFLSKIEEHTEKLLQHIENVESTTTNDEAPDLSAVFDSSLQDFLTNSVKSK